MFNGIVVHADKLGRRLGYPTANLDTGHSGTKLKEGVYAAYATLQGKKYEAALIIKKKSNRVEVHFLDYSGEDFYGQFIEVEPLQRVRHIIRFGSEEDLKKKIAEDVRVVSLVFSDRKSKN